MSQDYGQALGEATEAARAAGSLLREEFHRSGGPGGPKGHCPADREAENVIRDRLTTTFPDWG